MTCSTVKRILIVDDEEAILFSYKRLLQGRFLNVDTCGEIEAALEMIRMVDYDVVITDLRLSDSEGREGSDILRYAKQHKPLLPVIIVTGYGNDDISDEVYALGAYRYLDKPVAISALIDVLSSLDIISRL